MTDGGASAPLDVVYLVRQGDNPELRYSLRSLRNVAHGRVWIVGHKPEWVTGCRHIPIRQTSDKWANTRAGLLAACTHPDIGRFQLWNDDFYALQPTEIPVWHQGPIEPDRRNRNAPTHLDGGAATFRLLQRWGVDPVLDYGVHVPMVIDGQRMVEAFERAGDRIPALHRRTLYGNLSQIGGEQVEDVTVGNRRD
ncbi:MAG: hypothetical protein WEB67_02375, partial [Acidimicrobiia bacterium]